jgi:hypothetical protein
MALESRENRHLVPLEAAGRLPAPRLFLSRVLETVGTRPKDRLILRDAAAVVVAIYMRGAIADGFPREAPWTREINVVLTRLAESLSLTPQRVRHVIRTVLLPGGICERVSGQREAYRFPADLFEVSRTAEDLNWLEIAPLLEGDPTALQLFWVLAATLQAPASEPQHLQQNAVARLSACSRRTVGEKLSRLEQLGLVAALPPLPGRTKDGNRYALTELALSTRRLPEVRSLPLDAEATIPAVREPTSDAAPDATPPALQRVVLGGTVWELPSGTVIHVREENRELRIRLP